jgi:gamma-glutamyltranspeptidase/glutathione hydrolase
VPFGERVHRQIEVVEEVFLHRDTVARADARELLLSDEFIRRIAIPPKHTMRSGGPRGYNHTTAIAAADSAETVVSGLVSVFDVFGSATLVPEFEFLLNDRMLGFGEDPNEAAPGKRPVHTLVPIVVRSADAVMALATPGADGQVQTLLQLLTLMTGDGVELPDALERPRWRSLDGALLIERGFDSAVSDALAARGHQVRLLDYGDTHFGAAAAAVSTGTLGAASDPRREVWAEGV